MKRIKHNDLTHYFMTPHEDLPAQASSFKHRYTPTGILMVSCKDPKPELQAPSSKLQAPSSKLQAPSSKLQAPSKKVLDSQKIPDIK
jgi:hypothetical protein